MTTMRAQDKTAVLFALFAIALVNLAIFMLVADSLGGDALSGFIREGRYYLGNHGEYREVSARIYRYSQVHSIATFVIQVVGVLSGLWAAKRVGLPVRVFGHRI